MSLNIREYRTLHPDTYGSNVTWETIQHYTQTQIEVKEHERLYNNTHNTQIEVKEQFLVRKNMDVTEHERLYNISLRHRLKKRSSDFVDVLHFTVTIRSSIMSITHTLK